MSHKSFLLSSGVMLLLLMIIPAYLLSQNEGVGAFLIGAINALVGLSMFGLARYLIEPSAKAASQLAASSRSDFGFKGESGGEPANLFKEEIRGRSPKTPHELREQSSRSFAA